MHRFELAIFGALAIVWATASVFITWRMAQVTGQSPECFGHIPSGLHCAAIHGSFVPWEQAAQLLLAISMAAPIAVGIVLGVSVVAREVEQGTAQLAWSLSLTRSRWLGWRLGPVLIACALLLSMFAVGGEFLLRGRLGLEDPGFLSYASRGVILVIRGLMLFALAVLIGAWLGRVLPALLVMAVLTAALILGNIVLVDAWRGANARVVEVDALIGDVDLMGGLPLGQASILADGTVTFERDATLLPADHVDALRILPASQFWPWVIKESLLALLIGSLAVLATTRLLEGRRPR